jgi:MFS family permease
MRPKYITLVLLSSLSVLSFLDRNAVSVAGHRISSDLHLSESEFGWILTAFTLSYGLLEIPMGIWGDNKGEKPIIARIVTAWSFFTALTGMATGFASLFIIRFIFGAGEAGAYPNTAIAIRKWFSSEDQAKAQSYIWMSSRIGGAIAPLIVVPLQMHFGWRTTFFVLAVIGLIWVIVWQRVYKSPNFEQTKTVSANGSGSWTQHLRKRNFWLLLLLYFCYASGVFFFISWLPKYLEAGRGIAESDLRYSASLPFLLAAGGCMLGGWMSTRFTKSMGSNWGRKIVPIIGLTIAGLAMLCCVMVHNNVAAVILLALGMAAMDLTAPVAWAVATEMGGKSSGAVTGAMNTAGLLGGTICSLGIGYLITWSKSYQLPVVVLAGVMLSGAVVASMLNLNKHTTETGL